MTPRYFLWVALRTVLQALIAWPVCMAIGSVLRYDLIEYLIGCPVLCHGPFA